MKKNDSIDIASREVGGVPLIRQFFDRLDLERLIERYVPEKKLGRKPVLPAAKVLSVLVANTILSREPLYALSEWLERFVLEPFGLSERAAKLFNDDRVGRALDRLYSVDPASLLTAIVTKAIREFKIDLDQIHNDTTSVMFSGAYDGQTNAAEKAHPPTITFGHSKDHRPDLKQLVYSLTISSDGAVPIHFKTYDGNMTDDQTHIETWSTICKIKRNADFTYVADSKLCTRENMSFIHSRGGRFVTVLPRSRKEDDDFRDFLKTNSVNWKEIFRKQSRRGKKHVDIYKAYEPDERSSEGHRLIWFHSSIKEELDQRRRARRIKRARQRLRELEGRTGAHRFRSKETAETAAAAVLQEEGAERWIKVTVEEQLIGDVKQLSPGRPGKNTVYRKIDIPVILFDIIDRGDAIQEDARCDGIFGMITNLEEESDFEVFRIYKYQPFLEKRNEQLKTVRVPPASSQNLG